jgi:uncharacterized protein YdeI (YjbR/CyaY-like superfamily)
MRVMARDMRIDAYIARSPEFARPILSELRQRVHSANPGAVEDLKWGAPHFTYKGKLWAGMSAFKAHCAFGFWHPLMRPDDNSLEGMGQFGKIASLKDLPSAAEFARLAKQAMKLTDEGVPVARPKTAPKPLVVPAALRDALKKNAKARATFEAFSPSRRREYADWVAEAKTDATRERRVAQSIEWLAEGKSRHWKYQK